MQVTSGRWTDRRGCQGSSSSSQTVRRNRAVRWKISTRDSGNLTLTCQHHVRKLTNQNKLHFKYTFAAFMYCMCDLTLGHLCEIFVSIGLSLANCPISLGGLSCERLSVLKSSGTQKGPLQCPVALHRLNNRKPRYHNL